MWPRRHRRRATVLAAAFTAVGFAWLAVRWLPTGGEIDQLLDRGDRVSSIMSALLAAVGAGLAYVAWRRPIHSVADVTGTGITGVRPAQLPADTQLFTGRKDELARLRRKLVVAGRRRLVAVVAIDGMAGVGKTTLSIRLGHQLARRFPDGQLFIDLHGHSDRVAPTEPGDALGRLLLAVGAPPDRIPSDLEDRASLWRSMLAGRRLLLLLDNAASDAQVRPLLPGTPGSLVLTTSRKRLVGLTNTHTLSLDMLPAGDAADLLIRSVGRDRLGAEPPGLVAEVVELCCNAT